MPLVEVLAPKGALDGRTELTKRLLAEVMEVEGAPDTELARSISWLAVHDAGDFFVGGQPVTDADPPRYVVRVTVPGGSLNDEKRAEMVKRVTRLFAEAEDSRRVYEQPVAWVLINEVPDGNWGAFGQVVRLADIAAMVGGSADS